MLLNLSTIYKTRESDSYRKALSNMFLLITSRITEVGIRTGRVRGEGERRESCNQMKLLGSCGVWVPPLKKNLYSTQFSTIKPYVLFSSLKVFRDCLFCVTVPTSCPIS